MEVAPITTAFDKLWTGLKSGASTTFDSIGSSAKRGMNWIINHINNMINKINSKLRFTLPDIMGGATIGFSIPNIPKLARGGIINSPTIAQIGEAGPEAVVPLENTGFVKAIGDSVGNSVGNAILSIMQFINSGLLESGNTDSKLVIEIDGREVARALIPSLKRECRRLGVTFN